MMWELLDAAARLTADAVFVEVRAVVVLDTARKIKASSITVGAGVGVALGGASPKATPLAVGEGARLPFW